MSDATKGLYFMGLCWAQWAVILREVVKSAGFIAVTTGAITTQESDAILQGLTLLGGGGAILAPIVYQLYINSINHRIKEVAELPNVKGVVTDSVTAKVDLAKVPNVVSTPEEIKP